MEAFPGSSSSGESGPRKSSPQAARRHSTQAPPLPAAVGMADSEAPPCTAARSPPTCAPTPPIASSSPAGARADDGTGREGASSSLVTPPTAFPPIPRASWVGAEGGLPNAGRPATAGADGHTRVSAEGARVGACHSSFPPPSASAGVRADAGWAGSSSSGGAPRLCFKDRQRAGYPSPRGAAHALGTGAGSPPHSPTDATHPSSCPPSAAAAPLSPSPPRTVVTDGVDAGGSATLAPLTPSGPRLSFKERLRAGAGPLTSGVGSFAGGPRRQPAAVSPALTKAPLSQAPSLSDSTSPPTPPPTPPPPPPPLSSSLRQAPRPLSGAVLGTACHVDGRASSSQALEGCPTSSGLSTYVEAGGGVVGGSTPVPVAGGGVPLSPRAQPPHPSLSPTALTSAAPQPLGGVGSAVPPSATISPPPPPPPGQLSRSSTFARSRDRSSVSGYQRSEGGSMFSVQELGPATPPPPARKGTVVFGSSARSATWEVAPPADTDVEAVGGAEGGLRESHMPAEPIRRIPSPPSTVAGASWPHGVRLGSRGGREPSRGEEQASHLGDHVDSDGAENEMSVDLLGCLPSGPEVRVCQDGESEPVRLSMATPAPLDLDPASLPGGGRRRRGSRATSEDNRSEVARSRHSDPSSSSHLHAGLVSRRAPSDSARCVSDSVSGAVSASYLSETGRAPQLGCSQTFEFASHARPPPQQQQQTHPTLSVPAEPPGQGGGGAGAPLAVPVVSSRPTDSAATASGGTTSTTHRRRGKMVDRRTGVTVTFPILGSPSVSGGTPREARSVSHTTTTGLGVCVTPTEPLEGSGQRSGCSGGEGTTTPTPTPTPGSFTASVGPSGLSRTSLGGAGLGSFPTSTQRSPTEQVARDFLERLQRQAQRSPSRSRELNPPVTVDHSARGVSGGAITATAAAGTAGAAPPATTSSLTGASAPSMTYGRQPSGTYLDVTHTSAPESVSSQRRELVGGLGGSHSDMLSMTFNSIAALRDTRRTSSFSSLQFSMKQSRRQRAAVTAGHHKKKKRHVVVAPSAGELPRLTGDAPLEGVTDREGSAAGTTTTSPTSGTNPSASHESSVPLNDHDDDDDDDSDVRAASVVETKGDSDSRDGYVGPGAGGESEALLALIGEEEVDDDDDAGLQPRGVGMWETAEHIFIPTYERLGEAADLRAVALQGLQASLSSPTARTLDPVSGDTGGAAWGEEEVEGAAALAAAATLAAGSLSSHFYRSPATVTLATPTHTGQGPSTAASASPLSASMGSPVGRAGASSGLVGKASAKESGGGGHTGAMAAVRPVQGGAVFAFGTVSADYNVEPAEEDPSADCKVAARLLFDADHGVMLLAPHDEVGRFHHSRPKAGGDGEGDDDGACGCDEAFIGKDSRGMDYSKYHAHTLYDHCACCHRRPACFLCLHCFKAVCPTHVQRHHRRNPSKCTLYLNILDIMTSFDRIFWCERCRRFTWKYTEIYDPLVDQVAYTRGTYLPRAVRDIRCFGVEAVLREEPGPLAAAHAASLAASSPVCIPGLASPSASLGMGSLPAYGSPPHLHPSSTLQGGGRARQDVDPDGSLAGPSPCPVLDMGFASSALLPTSAASPPTVMHFSGSGVTVRPERPFSSSTNAPVAAAAAGGSGGGRSGGGSATAVSASASASRVGAEVTPPLIGTVASAGGSQCYSMPLPAAAAMAAAAASVTAGSLGFAQSMGFSAGGGVGAAMASSRVGRPGGMVSPMAELLHRDEAALASGEVLPIGSGVARLAAVGASVQGWRATQEDAEAAFLVDIPALAGPTSPCGAGSDGSPRATSDGSPHRAHPRAQGWGERRRSSDCGSGGGGGGEAGRIPMAVFCVFDGHGGDAVAKLAARHFEDHLRGAIARTRPDDVRARALLFHVDAETALSPRQRALSAVSHQPSLAASMTTPMASLATSPMLRSGFGALPRPAGPAGAMPSPVHLSVTGAGSYGSGVGVDRGSYRFAGPLLVPGAVLSGPAPSPGSYSPHRMEDSLSRLPSPPRTGVNEMSEEAAAAAGLRVGPPGGALTAILAPVTAASLAQHVGAEERQSAAMMDSTTLAGSPRHRVTVTGGALAGGGTALVGGGLSRSPAPCTTTTTTTTNINTNAAAAASVTEVVGGTRRQQQQAERASSLVRRWEQEGMAAITGANNSTLWGKASTHESARHSSPVGTAAVSGTGESSPRFAASSPTSATGGAFAAAATAAAATAAAAASSPRWSSSGVHYRNQAMTLLPSAVVTVPEVKMLQGYFASIMEDALLSLDDYLRQTEEGQRGDYNCVGCTACIVGVTPSFILCANLGDSGACFYNQEVIEPIAVKHRLSDPKEQERVMAAGYSIDNNRIEGMLAVPRALGDFDFKQSGGKGPREQAVIAVPDVTIRPVPTTTTEAVVRTAMVSGGAGVDGDNAEDRWGVILACDGVWDTATLHQVHHALVNTPNDLDVASSATEAVLRAKDLVRHHRRGPVHYLGDVPERGPGSMGSYTAHTSPVTRGEAGGMPVVGGGRGSSGAAAGVVGSETDDEDDLSYVEDLGGDVQVTEGLDARLLTSAAGVFAQCVAPADNEAGVGLDNCSLLLIERRA